MAEVDVDISFDDENRIRVMPKDKFKQTEHLEEQCKDFTKKINDFSVTVQMLVEVLDGEAKKIEYEKLRAIGQRNRAEMEAEARKRRQQQMQAMIADKSAEHERLLFQLTSFERAEREQRSLIEKLSNNDAELLWWGADARFNPRVRQRAVLHARCVRDLPSRTFQSKGLFQGVMRVPGNP
eukprot:CAMPEP_0171059274 /NCGR_PEP_ID=MMETSP0766_2-20121228/3090_1 /TAXON_ID=439317 /ORGANISM="Gambierdiscus australes, Strain CAWD 149" /LENGTH=180 /DNA_ID=CAMNT_0011514701 /DNA_START=68 /DNA_END=608 /DNA_ORIENTATION=+